MIEPMRAARPMTPRMASGVPAAMPQAPATMMTEIVARASRVTRNVKPAHASAKVDEVTGETVGRFLDRGARLLGALNRFDDAPNAVSRPIPVVRISSAPTG